MRHTRLGAFLAGMAVLVLIAAPAAAQQRRPEVQLEQALHVEQVEGDLQRAIGLYQRILAQRSVSRAVAAKAQLHIGLCYETLGRGEAQRAYERVIANYADQADEVREARARLAALRPGTEVAAATVARMVLTSRDSADRVIGNPGTTAPSPDGRRVAYAQTEREDAGVYVRDLGSGEVQQVVTRDPRANAGNYSVVWSPDGRRLAFVQTDADTRATTIRIVTLGSRENAAIPGLDARGLYLLEWSPDGRSLLCNHTGRNTLELVSIDDGTRATLSDSIWSGQRASFSPDGRFVAFARGPYRHESLYTQPLAGGPRVRIVDSQDGTYLHPLWSPDGRAIAFWRSSGLWVVPVTDGAASGAPRMAYRTDIPRWPVAWTEAGYFFAYVAESDIPHQLTVDPTTGRIGRADPAELPAYPDGPSAFAWAPDMRRVVFSRWNLGVSVLASDTRALTALDLGGDDAVLAWWSADGREVVYWKGDPATRMGQLKAIDPGTGRVRTLFPPMPGWYFSQSADGRRMAFMRLAAGSTSPELVVAETGHADGVVVAGPGPDGSRLGGAAVPAISPQGDQVLFVRQTPAGGATRADRAHALWIVGSDGTGARRLASARVINNARWDPSGRLVAFTARMDSARVVVLSVVEAATGAEQDRVVLPAGQRWKIADWSPDGRLLGVIGMSNWWEYWVVRGLEEGGR